MLKRTTSFTAAVLMSVAALTAAAKGPPSEADFVVLAELSASDWVSGTWVGTFSTSGIVEDSGDVYLVASGTESDGSFWQVYEFVGAAGSFQSALPIRPLPDHRDAHPIEIVGTGGAYVDLYAVGTANGRTHRSCHWVRDEPLYRGKVCTYTVDWTIEAYVP